jgi:hypothetical protein
MHTYSTGHVYLFVSLVLSASASLRGASRSIAFIFSFFGIKLPAPSWYSGRFWLLRIGYYKLTRKKEKADDWIWIIDHTIQLGKEKCLVIFGIRQTDLPQAETNLFHEDVESLAIFPVTHSNGDIVCRQLENTVCKTGVPRQIVGDHGTDVKAGVEGFCHQHPSTCFVYDIKHKVAALLKRELTADAAWCEFIKLAAETRKKVQQTALAGFAPPNQRTKARYMNVDKLVHWAIEVLAFLDYRPIEPAAEYDQQEIKDKLNWIIAYREDVAQWQELLQVVDTAASFVKFQGIYPDSHRDLIQLPTFDARFERAKRIREELICFLKEQSQKARPGERLLGSSEVLESAFGKLKYLEKQQSKSGFTVYLLSLAALVSKTTTDVVQKALESVSTKNVLEWFKDNVGQSVQSKRLKIKSFAKKKEQKRDQIHIGCFN